MEKWTRPLTERLENFQQRIQALLENEVLVARAADAPPFQPSRDPLLVEGLARGLPTDVADRAIVAFNRLSGLFEAGVLLESQSARWMPRAIFHDGVAKPLRAEKRVAVALPAAGPLEALRAPTAPVLRQMRLSELDPTGSWSAFLVKPVPEFAYILLSSLPDLWLRDHLERVIQSLAEGFAE